MITSDRIFLPGNISAGNLSVNSHFGLPSGRRVAYYRLFGAPYRAPFTKTTLAPSTKCNHTWVTLGSQGDLSVVEGNPGVIPTLGEVTAEQPTTGCSGHHIGHLSPKPRWRPAQSAITLGLPSGRRVT
jgi:hypothetical protein